MVVLHCNLCNEELTASTRCRAHIMPRGMMKMMAPDSYGNLVVVGTDMPRKKKTKTGVYDPGILCRKCDGLIGKYDEYALGFLNKDRFSKHSSGLAWVIKGIDQEKLKIFALTYLFRCSITNHDAFKGVNLGRQHTENLRKIILQGATAGPDEYGTILMRFNNEYKNYPALMFPASTRIGGVRYYEMYLPNLYKIYVKVDKREEKMRFRKVMLGYGDELHVIDKGDFETSAEMDILRRAAKTSN